MGFSYPFFLKNMNSYFFFILSFLLKGLVISNVRIERRMILDLQRLTEINSYIGLRHALTLPFMVNVRDQMQIHNVVNEFAY